MNFGIWGFGGNLTYLYTFSKWAIFHLLSLYSYLDAIFLNYIFFLRLMLELMQYNQITGPEIKPNF